MVNGDHQLDAAQAAPREATRKLGPECLGLGGADSHAEHFAPALAVDRDGDDHGDRDNAAVLTHLDVGGVEDEDENKSPDRVASGRPSASSTSYRV